MNLLFTRPNFSRAALFLALGSILVAGGWLYWLCWWNQSIHYLPSSGSAEWIVYPVPANVQAQRLGERTTIFSRNFPLSEVPDNPRLWIRAFGDYRVELNHRRLTPAIFPDAAWKRSNEIDIGPYLQPGLNDFVIEVTNSTGPPALWLWASAKNWSLASDSNWLCSIEHSTTQHARPASAPMPIHSGNLVGHAEETLPSLMARWPTLLTFLILAVALLASLAYLTLRTESAKVERIVTSSGLVFFAIAVLWLALFINNRSSLGFPIGFDSTTHLDYVHYVQEKQQLPLANEGWEMHQPPLFYLISALALGAGGYTTNDPAAVTLIRFINFTAAVVQIILIGACLRLLFPGRTLAQAAGLVIAAFLPMELYMAHYLSNDVLAATAATAAVYCCLKILNEREASTGSLLLLGGLLGAAILSKVTTLAIVPIVIGVVVGAKAGDRPSSPSLWLRYALLPLIACLVVGGWHYARVWKNFGSPLIGSFDVESGFKWWQDPGFTTSSYFMGFGRSLIAPFFSEFNGFMDGIYSTLWGDGLWGGVGELGSRPPWNYNLMAAGYLLALLPTAMIAIGAVAAVVQVIMHPRADWILLVGLSAAMALALVYQFLRLPYACHVKAFYGLPAAVSLAAFAGLGFDLITFRRRWLEALFGIGMAAWAMNTYATYWVVEGSAATQAWVALQLAAKNPSAALQHYQDALRADPDYPRAGLGMGQLLEKLKYRDESIAQFRHVLEANPDNGVAHVLIAHVLAQNKDLDSAILHARRARELEPDNVAAVRVLGILLAQQGNLKEAIRAYRDGLGLAPADSKLHYYLALTLGPRRADILEAIDHGRKALQWESDWPLLAAEANWLARVLATYPDGAIRNGREAVELANKACQITNGRDPQALDTLAAALAETGKFDDAMRIEQRAIDIKQAAMAPKAPSTMPALEEMTKRLKLYESRQPYREEPKP
jgi:tetratricopeptide (TPR) repeat protein